MHGLFLDDSRLIFREDLPEPEPGPGECLIEVLQAGICATDLALARGYMNFRGIPGHEFVGRALDGRHKGQRVVGDINAACGACEVCAAGDPHHCPNRTVLGILGRGGAFAERLVLPEVNLLPVADSISDDAAIFVEPLAAAFEIAEQVHLAPGLTALVAGDGKLGLLCAWVLAVHGVEVTVAGRHPERSGLLPETVTFETGLFGADTRPPARRWDLAVEATGNADVLPRLLSCVRPRGTLVLKTTTERATTLDLSTVVVDELTILGSRCGPFDRALAALATGEVPVEALISARFPLTDGPRALAAAPGQLKVVLEFRAP